MKHECMLLARLVWYRTAEWLPSAMHGAGGRAIYWGSACEEVWGHTGRRLSYPVMAL